MTALPPVYVIRDRIAVVILLSAYEDNGAVVCLIHTLNGQIDLPPRAWVRAVRDEITKLEQIAKSAGCAEMRIEGRNWSRVLRGLNYQPWPEGEGHGLRKAI